MKQKLFASANTSSQNDSLVFELSPKEKSLEEVSVAISNEVKDGWQKYGEFFTQNFIGQTKFAKQCVIKNPEVLHFYFNKKEKPPEGFGKGAIER